MTDFVERVVSSEDDCVVVVDNNDVGIGFMTKAAAHDGRGTLHRAFSVFVFNPDGELLLQQRAAEKRLWPGRWSNSCCSHPRRGEPMATAVRRRVHEELGLCLTTAFLFKFEYRAQFDAHCAEHELCWVHVGRSADKPTVNRHEVAAWRYVDGPTLHDEIAAAPDRFTPWFRIAWPLVAATAHVL
ncbi:isopentenyl-diphosphate Delta-isomerase [Mycobacterium sp. NPDC048908]|uniref:isopentenyl-diphosphate Delta-isomerase n=1 Tax=Mycobacterium sp. NPDC048908 TaxID=3364292 RepID=UPI003721FF62